MMGSISLLATAILAAMPLVVGVVVDMCTGNK